MISEVVANSTWFEYLADSDRIALLLVAVLEECVAHMAAITTTWWLIIIMVSGRCHGIVSDYSGLKDHFVTDTVCITLASAF